MNFEQYLDDFNSTINIKQFLLNILVVSLLSFLLKLFYVKYGKAISNRSIFSENFMPLALGTLLIITVIGSSVALSLGLVGALSIVRFRAAIKDPEELIYLFLIIGLGLTGGANKPLLAVVSFAIIIPILYLNAFYGKQRTVISKSATLHINTKSITVAELSNLIAQYADYLQLKRADSNNEILTASYHCTLSNPGSLDNLLSALHSKDADSKVSYVDKPDMLL